MVVRAGAVALSVGSLFYSLVASGQSQSLGSLPANAAQVRLSWFRAEGATSCIGVEALERDVSRRLSYRPFVGEPRQWIDGMVTVEAGQYVVRLFERDASGNTLGTRTLTDKGSDCRHLGEAVSLAIALIIDPTAPLSPLSHTSTENELVLSQPVSSGTNAASEVPTNLTQTLTEPPMQTVSTSIERGGLAKTNDHVEGPSSSAGATSVGQASSRCYDAKNPNKNHSIMLGSTVRSGVFPEPAIGVDFFAEGALGSDLPLEYRIGMVYFPEQKNRHDLATLSYGLTALVLGMCAKSRGELRGFGCVSVEGGALHTVVHDPNPIGPGDRAWVAARVELGGEWTVISPIFIQLRALGAVPLTQWDFYTYLNGQRQRAFAQPWIEIGASLGLGLRFF